MFSRRLPPSLTPTALHRATEAARRRPGFIDLTESNPTAVGIDFESVVLPSLLDPIYHPTPEGSPTARAAVADYYRRCHGKTASRLFLTASTSEGYSYAWKLLCNPGDRVLVPAPSYPLFETLCALDGVGVDTYPLHYERGWFLEADAIEVGPRTRAIVVVNPNNPTGSTVKRLERDKLVALAQRHNLAIIADEVFADYAATDSFVDEERALTLTLSGLSKVAALPQCKLGWMHVSGPQADEACQRLEHIADSYLSVSAMQAALPSLLTIADERRRLIGARLDANRALLPSLHPALTALESEGGWSTILRLPAILDETAWTEAFLAAGVAVQPGYFYDFAATDNRGPYVVISLLSQRFGDGIARLGEVTAAHLV